MAERMSPVRRFALTTPAGEKQLGLVGGRIAYGPQPITVDGQEVGWVVCTRRLRRTCSDYVASGGGQEAWGDTMKGSAAALVRKLLTQRAAA